MKTVKDISVEEGNKYGWGLILHDPNLLKDFLYDMFRKKGKLNILEIGCYKGHLVGWLHNNFPKSKYQWDYYGVDIIEPPDRRTDYPHLIMNAQALEFPPNTFDVVVALEVIEHIPHYPLALREIYRVLRPGGGFYMQSVICSSPSALLDRTHYHVLHPVTFKRLLEFLGFVNVKCVEGPSFTCMAYK